MVKGRGSTIGPMSGTPTAVCGNIEMGLPTCDRGSGKYCYWLKTCSNQMHLEDPSHRTMRAEVLYQYEKKRALEHGREISDGDPVFESEEFNAVLKEILEEMKHEGDE